MSRTSRRLQAELHSICQTYFPRWRNATTWTLREGPRGRFISRGRRQTTSEMGFCDESLKTIWVNCNPDHRTATLIHEVCHAVTGPGHGKRWCARLRAAGQQAARLGDAGLAAELIKEADSYADTPRVTASEIYCRVEQVLLDSPAATYEHLVEYLASEYGFTGPEILARYPRLPHFYAKYHRQIRRDWQRQLTMMKARGFPLERLASLETALQALESSVPG